MAAVVCPVCNARSAACAGHSNRYPPVDHPALAETEKTMVFEEEQKLAVYEFEQNGVTTTMQLSEEDAKNYPGAKKVGEVPERATTTPPGPADPEAVAGVPVTSKARTAKNKSDNA